MRTRNALWPLLPVFFSLGLFAAAFFAVLLGAAIFAEFEAGW
jgi:hypothetical protein